MILRPKEGQFLPVGEAYIHEIMQTGLRNETRKGEYHLRTFELI